MTPRLRPLDLIPLRTQDGMVLCLRDPQGYASSQVVVPEAALRILALMDGHHTASEIQERYYRLSGDVVAREEIVGLAEKLDELYFLDSPRFHAAREATDAEFRALPTRPAALAGSSYPEQGPELAALLEGLLEPHRDAAIGAGTGRPLQALLAPHIDYGRGGPAYGAAYGALAAGAGDADTFVILATGHQLAESYFALTAKGFETPLGTVATDAAFVGELAAAVEGAGVEDAFATEPYHRTEHAAELQVVWLQHLFGGRRPFTIVPVLVGSFHGLLGAVDDPRRDPVVAAFAAALSRGIAARPGRVVVIAGVDLAHMGPRFGDAEALTETDLGALERRDRATMDFVAAGDVGGLWRDIGSDGDARKICGFPPLATLLSALPLAGGTLLSYGQHPDPMATVTYASMAFPR